MERQKEGQTEGRTEGRKESFPEAMSKLWDPRVLPTLRSQCSPLLSPDWKRSGHAVPESHRLLEVSQKGEEKIEMKLLILMQDFTYFFSEGEYLAT